MDVMVGESFRESVRRKSVGVHFCTVVMLFCRVAVFNFRFSVAPVCRQAGIYDLKMANCKSQIVNYQRTAAPQHCNTKNDP
jgi:hypothetical protein